MRPEDRPAYVVALQEARSGQGAEIFDRLLYERLDATLDEYLTAARQALLEQPQHHPSIKPGPTPKR